MLEIVDIWILSIFEGLCSNGFRLKISTLRCFFGEKMDMMFRVVKGYHTIAVKSEI